MLAVLVVRDALAELARAFGAPPRLVRVTGNGMRARERLVRERQVPVLDLVGMLLAQLVAAPRVEERGLGSPFV